jgi:hypothetical protein
MPSLAMPLLVARSAFSITLSVSMLSNSGCCCVRCCGTVRQTLMQLLPLLLLVLLLLLLLLLRQVDFLLTAMRQLTAVRPDLKLLLMSATVDTTKLADHFSGAASGGPLLSHVAIIS